MHLSKVRPAQLQIENRENYQNIDRWKTFYAIYTGNTNMEGMINGKVNRLTDMREAFNGNKRPGLNVRHRRPLNKL